MMRDQIKIGKAGTSLVVQQLGLRDSNAGGTGSIPGWENRTLQVVQCRGKKVRPKAYIVEMEWEGNIKVESVGHGDRMLS